ncbi:Ger(x)C family spore germination protein [Paenibacillus arenilitoris]|uniref:Ger(X)C family spore germination protein n=1 Tax=Paenibacillus arenilitoris TaxID=2772299 RepID=A0A927CQC2_9BACL|nr:Ger(x)C family spore germination protein [Paenibacillus arenilitoris]MBD2869996.1 Ger(x)C family spore germination protein [Paenibacillus arenilitoris]
MRKKMTFAICIGLLAAALTGCWDIHYLTKKKIINGISLDASEDGQVAAAVRTLILDSKGSGQFEVKDQLIQATGDSVLHIGSIMDSMLPGTIEATKTHVFIIGEELAKRGVMSTLEFFYRDPKGYLTSNILISKGLASEVLAIKSAENSPAAYSIKQMVEGAVAKTIIPEQTLFTLWSQMTAPGVDTVLPVIHKTKNKALVVDNIGLFDGSRYSGVTLSRDESMMLLLLMNKLNKRVLLDIPMNQSSNERDTDEAAAKMITFQVRKEKRTMDVSVDKNTQQIECAVKVDLYGDISSYPTDEGGKVDRGRLKKELAEALNIRASNTANKLLNANCDALGIGRKLRVSHPELWKSIDWKNEYKDVKLKTSVQVHIRSTGVIS